MVLYFIYNLSLRRTLELQSLTSEHTEYQRYYPVHSYYYTTEISEVKNFLVLCVK